MTSETRVQQHTGWPMLLGIKLKDGISDFERAEVSDALNETLHVLADDGLVDDTEDDGWSYVNPIERAAPDLLAALEALVAWIEADVPQSMASVETGTAQYRAAQAAIRRARGED